MRPLSGYSKFPLSLFLLAAMSCASAPPASSPAEQFELTGALLVEGTQPFDRDIVLVDSQGIRWNLDPGRLATEMRLLDGYGVVLTCRGIEGRGSERDAEVQSYLLIPPDGMIALLGSLFIEKEAVFLVAGDRRLVLEGPLAGALKAFGENRVWVWGEAGGGDALVVSGYEILGP